MNIPDANGHYPAAKDLPISPKNTSRVHIDFNYPIQHHQTRHQNQHQSAFADPFRSHYITPTAPVESKSLYTSMYSNSTGLQRRAYYENVNAPFHPEQYNFPKDFNQLMSKQTPTMDNTQTPFHSTLHIVDSATVVPGLVPGQDIGMMNNFAPQGFMASPVEHASPIAMPAIANSHILIHSQFQPQLRHHENVIKQSQVAIDNKITLIHQLQLQLQNSINPTNIKALISQHQCQLDEFQKIQYYQRKEYYDFVMNVSVPSPTLLNSNNASNFYENIQLNVLEVDEEFEDGKNQDEEPPQQVQVQEVQENNDPISNGHVEIPRNYKNFNHYEILGVNPDSSLSEIRSAFKRLILTHHPDKTNVTSMETVDYLTRLKVANDALTDNLQRTQYDSINSHNYAHYYGQFDTVSLDDLKFYEDYEKDIIVWYKDCQRCQAIKGIEVSSDDLENFGYGVQDHDDHYRIIMVQCSACSLCVNIKYFDLDDC